MNSEKRMIGEYTVLTSITIGKYEIAICENEKAPKDEVFICGFIENNGVFERLTECFGSDSYADIATVYGERITEKARELQKQIEKEITITGTGDPELFPRDCFPVSEISDLEGKIVVIDGSVLRPEFRRSTHQLMLCTGGFGSKSNARGRTCFCTRLYDGKPFQFRRTDIIGTISESELPEWARTGLASLTEKKKETEVAR